MEIGLSSSYPSLSRRFSTVALSRKIVAIQKFCYHVVVTSYFSSLLPLSKSIRRQQKKQACFKLKLFLHCTDTSRCLYNMFLFSVLFQKIYK